MGIEKNRVIKNFVIYSNLLVVPWLLISIYFFGEKYLIHSFILFILAFKLPLMFIVPRLKCPNCKNRLVPPWHSLAFLKACPNCKASIKG